MELAEGLRLVQSTAWIGKVVVPISSGESTYLIGSHDDHHRVLFARQRVPSRDEYTNDMDRYSLQFFSPFCVTASFHYFSSRDSRGECGGAAVGASALEVVFSGLRVPTTVDASELSDLLLLTPFR